MFSSSDIDTVYQARQARLIHPDGHFDKQGRWYPSEKERCTNAGCPGTLRAPTKAWRYSWMLHCRTRKHCAYLAACEPDYFQTILDAIDRIDICPKYPMAQKAA